MPDELTPEQVAAEAEKGPVGAAPAIDLTVAADVDDFLNWMDGKENLETPGFEKSAEQEDAEARKLEESKVEDKKLADSVEESTRQVEPKPEPVVVEPVQPQAPQAPDELAALRDANQRLMKQLEDLQGLRLEMDMKLKGLTPAVAAKPGVEQPTTQPAQASNALAIPEDFLGDLELDDVIADKKLFNQVIAGAVKAAIANASHLTAENVIRSIPTLVTSQLEHQTAIHDAVGRFYEVNKDLVPFKKTVGALANEISAKDPKKTMQEVFTEAAKQTREYLGITGLQPAENASPPGATKPPQSPAFATPRGGVSRGGKGTPVSGIQKQIDDLIL